MEQEFYFLDDKDGFAEAIYEETEFERVICEECEGNRILVLGNINVSFRGSRKGNYYWVPGHFLVDQKLKELLQENNITGFELKDINVVGSYGFHDDGIQELVITGRAGHLQKLNGDEFGTCSKCGRILENKSGVVGASFDLAKWDGSDIFLIENFQGIPVVTERVKDLLTKKRIKNVRFINMKEKVFV